MVSQRERERERERNIEIERREGQNFACPALFDKIFLIIVPRAVSYRQVDRLDTYLYYNCSTCRKSPVALNRGGESNQGGAATTLTLPPRVSMHRRALERNAELVYGPGNVQLKDVARRTRIKRDRFVAGTETREPSIVPEFFYTSQKPAIPPMLKSFQIARTSQITFRSNLYPLFFQSFGYFVGESFFPALFLFRFKFDSAGVDSLWSYVVSVKI